MMTDNPLPSSDATEPQPLELPAPKAEISEKKSHLGLIIGGVVVFILLVGLVILLFSLEVTTTAKIRDVFLIFLALQTFIIGIVLIILVVQVSMLVNLVRNEIKPVIENTQQTVNTLRGTATFLSENLASPVIKSNSILAALRRFFQLLFPRAKRK